MKRLPFEYAFRNLGRSPLRLVALIVGAALVVVLALAAAGFVRGMQRTLTSSAGLNDNVIILGAGSEEAIERSQIDAGIDAIASASVPGLRQEAGIFFASPEIHMALPIREARGAERERQAVMRGVVPVALLVHPEVEVIEGRPPRPGEDELMVGSLAHVRLDLPASRLGLGETLHFDNRDWRIVGRFSAPGTVMDAEIWLPLTDLQIATKREASLSCVVVSLGAATFTDVDIFAKSRLDLEIVAVPEREYYQSIAAFYRPIRLMIVVTATLVGAGALIGGLNTMYASFASRVREVGMLQALGYAPATIIMNLTEESTFAAACGTLLGCAVGLLALDGIAVRFSMGAFALTLDAPVMLVGAGMGLLVGLVGAAAPAIRCLRLPITQALKTQ